MAEDERRPSGPTSSASETGGGKRRQPSAAGTPDRGSRQEAVCPREAAVRARHGRTPHKPDVPQAHRQLRQEADRGHGRSQVR